jgi:hypothetical protein
MMLLGGMLLVGVIVLGGVALAEDIRGTFNQDDLTGTLQMASGSTTCTAVPVMTRSALRTVSRTMSTAVRASTRPTSITRIPYSTTAKTSGGLKRNRPIITSAGPLQSANHLLLPGVKDFGEVRKVI